MIDLAALVLSCAPLVAPDTARALIQVESAGNTFAIGIVGGSLVRQPTNLPEALATVAALEAAGWNYSLGLGQINKRNFARYGLSPATAFEPCTNLAAMQGILGACFSRASRQAPKQQALRDAFSCYYSGNFLTGHRHGYVRKVLAAWAASARLAGMAPSGLTVALALTPAGQAVPQFNPVSSPVPFVSINPGMPQ